MATAFSDKETLLICAMIKNMEVPIKVNWNAVSAETGHATGASAQRQWCKLKLKHEIGGSESPTKGKGDAGDETPSGKTTNKRKAAVPKDELDDDKEEGSESPVKAKKARQTNLKKKAEVSKVKEEPEEELEEEAV